MISNKPKIRGKTLLLCLLFAISIPINAIAQQGTLKWDKITSPAIEVNLISDRATRSFAIYLPPSYETGLKSYPSVYMLHGYTQNAGSLTNIKPSLDFLIRNGRMGEMIVIFVDGYNKFRGSCYLNSPSIGNYEKYITSDLVNYVDKNYRTVNRRECRGITGLSMGG